MTRENVKKNRIRFSKMLKSKTVPAVEDNNTKLAEKAIHETLIAAAAAQRIDDSTQNAMADSNRIALEIANKAKSAFLANMSHEIRTPLAAIVGFAEIVSAELNHQAVQPEVSNHVEAILRNSKHLLALINDILDISKIDSEAFELETNSILFRDELHQIVQMLGVKAQQHNDRVLVTCSEDLPLLISTDPTKLRQILINLISNAIKFTEHGTIEIIVDRIAGKKQNKHDFISFKIKDSGIGIAGSNQAKLFSSYGQADRSTSRRFGGTGLGLMLAKKLAKILGGDVFLVSSTLGFGSTFEFQIPLTIAENSVHAGAEKEKEEGHSGRNSTSKKNGKFSKSAVSEKSIRGCRVLLAEDSPDMQNLVGHIVKSKGGEIQFAKNGRDAIEKANKGEFDLILMDVEMPVLDGNEANKQLRKQGTKVPIIAFTAHAFISKEHFNNAVYDDYLTKPITSNQLVKTINRWYHSH